MKQNENKAKRKVIIEKLPKPNYEILELLSEAPDGILDKRICNDIALLIKGKPEDVAIGLLKAREMCQYSALGAPIAIMMIAHERERLTNGVMPDESLCTWRKDWS